MQYSQASRKVTLVAANRLRITLRRAALKNSLTVLRLRTCPRVLLRAQRFSTLGTSFGAARLGTLVRIVRALMGAGGLFGCLRGVLKPLLVVSATVTVRCVSVELRSAFMVLSGSIMRFFWHCLTPFGIYPLSKSDESRKGVVFPPLQARFMRPKANN